MLYNDPRDKLSGHIKLAVGDRVRGLVPPRQVALYDVSATVLVQRLPDRRRNDLYYH